MYQYACLVNHSKIEWAPVLPERKVQKLVVDGEVVVRYVLVLFINDPGTLFNLIRALSDRRRSDFNRCGAVENLGLRCRVGKGGEVKSVAWDGVSQSHPTDESVIDIPVVEMT